MSDVEHPPLVIPVLDLATYAEASEAERAAIATALTTDLESVGFLVVVGHGISPLVFDEMRDSAAAFFALDPTDKVAYLPAIEGAPGYYPVEAGSLATTMGHEVVPDLKESFTIGPIDRPDTGYLERPGASRWFPVNPWPAVDGMRTTWSATYEALTDVANRVFDVLAVGLGVDAGVFRSAFVNHTSTLSAIHYPPRPPSDADRIRAGAHSDYGSLTLLHKQRAADQLQVLDAAGRWHAVVAPDGGLVVNIGDLLARWVNDRWVSTVHRVVAPSTSMGSASIGSISIGYFHQPDFDAVIAPLDVCIDDEHPRVAEAFVAGEHLAAKMTRQHAATS